MSKKCCTHECNQGRTCPTVTRMPTEFDDYDYEFEDSVFGLLGKTLSAVLAAFGVCLILIGVAGYLLNRS